MEPQLSLQFRRCCWENWGPLGNHQGACRTPSRFLRTETKQPEKYQKAEEGTRVQNKKEMRMNHGLETGVFLRGQHTRDLLGHKSVQERHLDSSPTWYLLSHKTLHLCCF